MVGCTVDGWFASQHDVRHKRPVRATIMQDIQLRLRYVSAAYPLFDSCFRGWSNSFYKRGC